MSEMGDQEFYDSLVNAADDEADTYTDGGGNEIEIVDAADLTRVYDYDGHRQTAEQAFQRLLGG